MSTPSLPLATPATGFLDMAGRIHETRTAAERAPLADLLTASLVDQGLKSEAACSTAWVLLDAFDITPRRRAS